MTNKPSVYIGSEGRCSTCRYPAKVLHEYVCENILLEVCDICYSTVGSEIYNKKMPLNNVIQIICYVGNAILSAIKDLKETMQKKESS